MQARTVKLVKYNTIPRTSHQRPVHNVLELFLFFVVRTGINILLVEDKLLIRMTNYMTFLTWCHVNKSPNVYRLEAARKGAFPSQNGQL